MRFETQAQHRKWTEVLHSVHEVDRGSTLVMRITLVRASGCDAWRSSPRLSLRRWYVAMRDACCVPLSSCHLVTPACTRQPRDHLDHQAALFGFDALVECGLVIAR